MTHGIFKSIIQRTNPWRSFKTKTLCNFLQIQCLYIENFQTVGCICPNITLVTFTRRLKTGFINWSKKLGKFIKLCSPDSNNNSLTAVFPTVAVYLRPWKTGLKIQRVVLLISSDIVRNQLLAVSKIRVHDPCFCFHRDMHDRHDEYIHVDHLGDRIGQSNPLLGYPILLQPHLCKIKFLNI